MDELKQRFIDVINKHLENPDISAAEIQSLAAAYESLERNIAVKELFKYTNEGGYFSSKRTDACVSLEDVKTNE